MKIYQINNKINFAQSQQVQSAPAQTKISAVSDTISIQNKQQPPVISNFDLTFNRITDKQIAQINEAKMLPANARFEKLYAYGGRNAMLSQPIYQIVPHLPLLPKTNEHTKILPKGYQVVKITKGRLNGFIGAVPVPQK